MSKIEDRKVDVDVDVDKVLQENKRLRDIVRSLRVLAGEGYSTYFYQQNLQREYDEELVVVGYGSMLYELTKHGVWINRDNLAAERIFEDEGLETEKRGREEKEIEGSAPFGDGKRHELKIWPEHFAAVTHLDKLRRKTVEIRKDDRGYQVGDVLLLREWYPGSETYTGRQVEAFVTHIMRGWGLQDGWVALSILLQGDGGS